MKKCKSCKKTLSIWDFYFCKRDLVYYGECKLCRALRSRKNYENNIELYRISSSKRYLKNKKNIKTKHQLFFKTKEGKLRERAYGKVKHAIYMGRIKRLMCVICGKNATDAHHEDYNKPLKIIWLCRRHHSLLHNHKKGGVKNGKKCPKSARVRV